MRFVVLGLTASMSVLLYLDRVCIALAGPEIANDLCLGKTEMSFVYGSFFLAYALGQVPAGWLGDRFGARLVLAGCVLGWSLFTGLTGLATGLVTLAAARLLFGVSQAGAYPIAARINSVWVPLHRRGFANGLINLGGRGGGALAPLLTAPLLLTLADWRPVFVLYALLGVAWTALFWDWYRPTPAQHPDCNAAEVELIEQGRSPQEAAHARAATGLPWRPASRSLSLWMQCLAQFAVAVPWTFLVTWMPTYLKEKYRTDLATAGVLSSLPLIAGVLGCLVGGAATDWLTARLGLKWGRNTLGIGSKFLAAAGLLACLAAPNAWVATLALVWMSFAMDTGQPASWAYFQDAGGRYVGTLLGFANMFGNLGSFVSPLLVGALTQAYGWTVALAVCAALFAVSGLAWFGVDGRVQVVPEPADPQGGLPVDA